MSRFHELKTWPEPFEAVADGRKTFELRKNDRNFKVGDVLKLCRYEPTQNAYTGESIFVKVRFIMRGPGWGLHDGYVAMAIDPNFSSE